MENEKDILPIVMTELNSKDHIPNRTAEAGTTFGELGRIVKVVIKLLISVFLFIILILEFINGIYFVGNEGVAFVWITVYQIVSLLLLLASCVYFVLFHRSKIMNSVVLVKQYLVIVLILLFNFVLLFVVEYPVVMKSLRLFSILFLLFWLYLSKKIFFSKTSAS